YVYWSTATYVRGRSDRAIAAEQLVLRQSYDRAGRDGLIAAIGQRSADERFEGWVFLLADRSLTPVAGNLNVWPSVLNGPEGWGNFNTPERRLDTSNLPVFRAAFDTLPNGYHLLVGKDIDDLDAFAKKIELALALSVVFTFVLGVVTAVFVTRRTMRRIEAINATSRAIMQTG